MIFHEFSNNFRNFCVQAYTNPSGGQESVAYEAEADAQRGAELHHLLGHVGVHLHAQPRRV